MRHHFNITKLDAKAIDELKPFILEFLETSNYCNIRISEGPFDVLSFDREDCVDFLDYNDGFSWSLSVRKHPYFQGYVYPQRGNCANLINHWKRPISAIRNVRKFVLGKTDRVF